MEISDAPTAAPSSPPRPGALQLVAGQTLLGRYQVERMVGRGHEAPRFVMFDLVDKKQLLIDLIPPEHLKGKSGDVDIKRTFRKAFEAAEKLDHPAIARPTALEEWPEAGGLFIFYEHLEGRTLAQDLQERGDQPFSLEGALPILKQVAAALDYAHGLPKPIVHGRLTPSQILLGEDGGVRLTGFGPQFLPLRETPDRDLTYLAPEQIKGFPITPRTDLYALAAIAYEMLAGAPLFSAKRGTDIIRRILKENPAPIPALPDRINQPLLAALRLHASLRPANAEEMLQGLTGELPVELFKRSLAGKRVPWVLRALVRSLGPTWRIASPMIRYGVPTALAAALLLHWPSAPWNDPNAQVVNVAVNSLPPRPDWAQVVPETPKTDLPSPAAEATLEPAPEEPPPEKTPSPAESLLTAALSARGAADVTPPVPDEPSPPLKVVELDPKLPGPHPAPPPTFPTPPSPQQEAAEVSPMPPMKSESPGFPESRPGPWFVMAGSFSKEPNAVALVNRLTSLGIPGWMEQKAVKEKSYTRVVVGPFADRESGQEAKDILERRTGDKAALIKKKPEELNKKNLNGRSILQQANSKT